MGEWVGGWAHVESVVPAVGRIHVVSDMLPRPAPRPLRAVGDEHGCVIRLHSALLRTHPESGTQHATNSTVVSESNRTHYTNKY